MHVQIIGACIEQICRCIPIQTAWGIWRLAPPVPHDGVPSRPLCPTIILRVPCRGILEASWPKTVEHLCVDFRQQAARESAKAGKTCCHARGIWCCEACYYFLADQADNDKQKPSLYIQTIDTGKCCRGWRTLVFTQHVSADLLRKLNIDFGL